MATAGRLVIEEAYEQLGWKEAFLPEIFVFIFQGTKVNATYFTFQFFYGGFLLKGPAPKSIEGETLHGNLTQSFLATRLSSASAGTGLVDLSHFDIR